MVDKNKY